MKIYVKYCGGCNPRFDRKALVKELEDRLNGPEGADREYVFSKQYDDPDISLVVCGCPSACAEKSDAAAPYGVFTIWQPEAAGEFIRFAEMKNSRPHDRTQV